MNEMQVFSNEQFGEMRTIVIDGEPWFSTIDACRGVLVNNPSQVLARLDEDEKMTTLILNESAATGTSQMSFVSEAGLYKLVLGSRKPEANAFKRWVTHDVLPSIRKHGMYATPQTIDNIINDPDFGIRLLTELKNERQKNSVLTAQNTELQEKIEADKPKVDFADALLVCDNCSYIEELAKHLCQIGMRTGRNRLIAEMAEDGFLCTRNGVKNMPTQKCVESGWLVIERKPHFEGDHSVMGYTTKVTPNGMQHFIEYYMRKHGLLPLLTTARQRQPRRKAMSMSGYEKRDNWR